MIKRIIYLLACCLVICSLAGCAGNGDDEADMPDVHSLADMLMQNVKFEDSVEEVSSETALKYYGIDSVQVQDSAVYMSTGATAEELAMGFYLDGKATAVVGTHTHVQTADEKVLPGGTAYITDLGMTGPELSVLGVRPEASISWLKTGLPTRFEISGGACMMCGAIIDVDEKTGKSRSIERICVR